MVYGYYSSYDDIFLIHGSYWRYYADNSLSKDKCKCPIYDYLLYLLSLALPTTKLINIFFPKQKHQINEGRGAVPPGVALIIRIIEYISSLADSILFCGTFTLIRIKPRLEKILVYAPIGKIA